MTRRRLLCGLLLASMLLVGFGGWLWLGSGPRVSKARFEEVRKGMTWIEGVRTVGALPGNYLKGHGIEPPLGVRYSDYESWHCDDGLLFVRFDEADKAVDVEVFDVFLWGPPTLTERIRRWLGL